jgi:iron(III) transport system ATP-binding protein
MSVQIRGVYKSYGDVVALDGVDLTLAEGGLTALLGPSGCGKTTTLRVIAGFEQPDIGEVSIDGEVVAAPGRSVAPERRRVGVVFQHLALFPHLSVAGNVAYGLRGGGRRSRAERVAAMLELVGLQGLDKRLPHELSGGQAQRVALARALAPEPGVVLLDEPFSSLDVALRTDLRAEVRSILRNTGVTTLLVTHDQGEALSMGDRVAVMFDGRVVQSGSPEDLYRRPASAAVGAFLGEANAITGVAQRGRLDTEIGAFDVSVDDGPAVALVRPEDIDIIEDPTGGAIIGEVRYFGHDQLVAVRLPSGQSLDIRLHRRHQLTVGGAVRVVANPDGPIVAFSAR